MWVVHRRFLTTGLATLVALGLSLPANAATDREQAIAQLEARAAQLETRADRLQRAIRLPPKRGRLPLAQLRSRSGAIDAEIARLEAGGVVDATRLATLLRADPPAPTSPEAIARRGSAKRETLRRTIATGPKVGALYRQAVRKDLRRLDRLIAELESGTDLASAELSDLLGIAIAEARMSPEQRLRESELRLASMERRLGGGPKLGVLRRAAIRQEIDALDALIDQLEAEVGR